jgi:DUF917 family protein
MIVIADGYQLNFEKALSAFVFDEKSATSPHFHDAPMKAVDVIAEFEEYYLFIEIKEFDNPEEFAPSGKVGAPSEHQEHFKWLKNYLKYKFRDTFLFRYAEDKVDKPVYYLCLLNFEDALNSHMKKVLSRELPTGKASSRWSKELASKCQVINENAWRRNFPEWGLVRI